MKKLIIIMILAGSAAYSYFHSEEVYHYYLTTYYFKVKKHTRESLMKEADILYKENKYHDLEDYLEKLMVVYPDDFELRKAAAMNYMKLEQRDRAADMILSIKEKTGIPDEMFEGTVESLYDRGFYKEIADIMRHRGSDNPNILFYYGISLYSLGDNNRSIQTLKQAINNGKTDFLPYYHVGLAYERMKQYPDALHYYREAWTRKYRDNDVNRSLVRVYRVMGKYDEASKMLRLMKKW